MDDPRVLRVAPFSAMGTPMQLVKQFGSFAKFEARCASSSKHSTRMRCRHVGQESRQGHSGHHAKGRRRAAHFAALLDVFSQDRRRPRTRTVRQRLLVAHTEGPALAGLGRRSGRHYRRRAARLCQFGPVSDAQRNSKSAAWWDTRAPPSAACSRTPTTT